MAARSVTCWRRRRLGSPGLLDHTLQATRNRGLETFVLPLWMDVDEPDDLAMLARLEGHSAPRGEPLVGLREVYLHVTHRCRRNCRHCYNRGAIRDPQELTTAQWKAAVNQARDLGATSFVFIGGDPLLRDDFVELVDHVTGACAARARFFFNSLVNTRRAAALARAGHGRLTPLASIDGPRAINDELRGPGSYDDVMTSLANLRAVGLEPVANTVLVQPVLAGLSQLARELRAAGLSRLHLILPHQLGGLPQDSHLVPSGQGAAHGRTRAARHRSRGQPSGRQSPVGGDVALAPAMTSAPPAAAIWPSILTVTCTPV